jgi:23S rRNA pseudouridine955/2504/2580 synthase
LQKTGLKRMFLHAARLALPHPLSAELLEFEAPLPADLRAFVARLDVKEKREWDDGKKV